MKFLSFFVWILIIAFFTILTQVGGIVLLLCLPVFTIFNRYKISRLQKRLVKLALFILFYIFITFIIIPPIAKIFGREPLPMLGNGYLQPVNIGYCLLNRHYVKPSLKIALLRVAEKFATAFPGAKIAYLDANFPFWDDFPLLPHLSHDDGKKVDLAFLYLNAKNRLSTNYKPSFTGYGVFENPKKGEINQTEICKSKGYWQYDINRYMGLINRRKAFILDENRTKRLLELLTQEKTVRKILLEPHLKTRLKMQSNKIRFQGCQAARHDDHLHVQIQ